MGPVVWFMTMRWRVADGGARSCAMTLLQTGRSTDRASDPAYRPARDDAAQWAIEMGWRGSAHPQAAIRVGDGGLARAIGQGKRVFGFWVLGNHVALHSPSHLNSVMIE
jgi:hypothetical protein